MRLILLSFVLWTVSAALFACGQEDDVPAYEARVQAAKARVTEATCACLWTEELRQQCQRYAGSALDMACSGELASQLARAEPSYADCLAQTSERQARCLEEAGCSSKGADCTLDARSECGPVPEGLTAELARCLPRYQCDTGQQLSLDRRCDGKQDCFDGSDELNCN